LFAAMRRALVIAAAMLAVLLAAAPASAQEVEREVSFRLLAPGFDVVLDTTNNDGDVSATLIVSRGPQVAYYSTPAKVTAKRVTARFGALGELDFTYAPKAGGETRCTGSEDGVAIFDGSFTFTGENGYIEIEATHAEGVYQVYPEPPDCRNVRAARRVVPYSPTYSDEGVTFRGTAGTPAGGEIRELTVFDEGGRKPHRIGVFAALYEEREGMTIARGLQLAARSSAFHWNLEAGTATLRPPAPFTGSAHFVRHGNNGHGTWTGSLGMPIFGGETVDLAGPAFRAFIHKGLPQDE
jgi:hypothetical protein